MLIRTMGLGIYMVMAALFTSAIHVGVDSSMAVTSIPCKCAVHAEEAKYLVILLTYYMKSLYMRNILLRKKTSCSPKKSAKIFSFSSPIQKDPSSKARMYILTKYGKCTKLWTAKRFFLRDSLCKKRLFNQIISTKKTSSGICQKNRKRLFFILE